MTEELLTRMASASHLLPDPGGEVVRECLAEISRLRSENEGLKDQLRWRAGTELPKGSKSDILETVVIKRVKMRFRYVTKDDFWLPLPEEVKP